MNQFSNIMFIANPDGNDSVAFAKAIALANNNQAKLSLIGLVDSLALPSESIADIDLMHEAIVSERQQQLQDLIQEAADKALINGLEIETKVLIGAASIEIIREVLRQQRDLVVKSVEPTKGILWPLFSGTDMKLLRKCPCPVWLVKANQQHSYRDILVALDYEPNNPENDALNQRLLATATAQALADFSQLHVVHAWHLPHEEFLRSPREGYSDADVDRMVKEQETVHQRWLEELVDEHCSKLGPETTDFLDPQLHVIKGDPKTVVPDCARDLGSELAVVGTVARTGVPGFVIGNTAEAILNRIDCSVLAIKPAGFISPVTLLD